MLELNRIIQGDCITELKKLPDQSVNCCVTSPPYYGLRDYGKDGQIGLEATPEEYVSKMVEVFAEVKRVLKNDGTLWLNLGDSYARSGGDVNDFGSSSVMNGSRLHDKRRQSKSPPSMKPKDLIGIPWMVAFALRANGWYLRQDIIWSKPNPMPESVTDRCTKAHEYIFLLSKSGKYYYDADAIKTDSIEIKDYSLTHRIGNKRNPDELTNGFRPREESAIYELANKRSVWTVTTMPYAEAHFATFPERLIVDCIKAGCPEFVCNKCGEARVPIFDVKPMVIKRSERREQMGQPNGIAASGTVVSNRESKFTGFSDCGCNAGFSPGVVLDPFMGAGTTALVSRKLDRNYLGIELNPKYIGIAQNRLKTTLGMFL